MPDASVPAPMDPQRRPRKTLQTAVHFATAAAFSAFVEDLAKQGVRMRSVSGLMHLPDPKVTQQFQDACRAVVADLHGAMPRTD